MLNSLKVGGVRYNALSPVMLEECQDHLRLVSIQNVKRRSAMQAFSYGTMTAGGVRQGRAYKGDGYVPYKTHTAEDRDGYEALFRQGKVHSSLLFLDAHS